jgi:hypothetical protein
MLALSNGAGVPIPHLKAETDPVSEMLRILFEISDDAQSPEAQSF